MYNEVRLKRIEASAEADLRSVFEYESLSEDRAIFTQLEFQFQDPLPSLLSRFAITVPNGGEWKTSPSITVQSSPS